MTFDFDFAHCGTRGEAAAYLIGFHADHVRAKFVHDGLGVVNQRRVVTGRDDVTRN